jgi:hypothetical protein
MLRSTITIRLLALIALLAALAVMLGSEPWGPY